jgi:hypothetical protein
MRVFSLCGCFDVSRSTQRLCKTQGGRWEMNIGAWEKPASLPALELLNYCLMMMMMMGNLSFPLQRKAFQAVIYIFHPLHIWGEDWLFMDVQFLKGPSKETLSDVHRASSRSPNQVPHLLWIPKVHYRVCKSPPPGPITPYFFKSHFNSISSSRSSKFSFPFRFFD